MKARWQSFFIFMARRWTPDFRGEKNSSVPGGVPAAYFSFLYTMVFPVCLEYQGALILLPARGSRQRRKDSPENAYD